MPRFSLDKNILARLRRKRDKDDYGLHHRPGVSAGVRYAIILRRWFRCSCSFLLANTAHRGRAGSPRPRQCAAEMGVVSGFESWPAPPPLAPSLGGKKIGNLQKLMIAS
jgi:hypothetical protein